MMTPETNHLKEKLQELLDGRLSAQDQLLADDHLKLCSKCSDELNALRWTKELSRRSYALEPPPANLEEKLLAALHNEDKIPDSRPIRFWRWWLPQPSMAAYGILLFAAIVLASLYFLFQNPERQAVEIATQPEVPEKPIAPTELVLPAEVAQDYQNYKADKLSLQLKTTSVGEMEKFFAANGLDFETRVFDLVMMNYHLTGGRVHQLADRKSALFVYRGKRNEILICQMYPGKANDLPADAEVRENKGIRFYIYRINGLTSVFWQEGSVTCVLTSDINTNDTVALAFAKAMPESSGSL